MGCSETQGMLGKNLRIPTRTSIHLIWLKVKRQKELQWWTGEGHSEDGFHVSSINRSCIKMNICFRTQLHSRVLIHFRLCAHTAHLCFHNNAVLIAPHLLIFYMDAQHWTWTTHTLYVWEEKELLSLSSVIASLLLMILSFVWSLFNIFIHLHWSQKSGVY